MSFIQFDEERCEVPQPTPEEAVCRLAWDILSTFAVPEEATLNPDNPDDDRNGIEYGCLTTEALDPLKGKRILYFDQMPLVNDRFICEPGFVVLRIVGERNNGFDRQVIFRLPTHRDGPGVFLDGMDDETRITDETELKLLYAKLMLIKDMYWHLASSFEDSAMLTMPRNEVEATALALIIEAAGDDEEN